MAGTGASCERGRRSLGARGDPINLNQVTAPALEVAASVAFYRRLGLVQIVGAPHYARFECPAGNSTFSIHRADHVAEPGVVGYFEVESLDQRCQELTASGIVFEREPRDEPWLGREAQLKGPSGNVICLYRAGENRRNPPWRIATGASREPPPASRAGRSGQSQLIPLIDDVSAPPPDWLLLDLPESRRPV